MVKCGSRHSAAHVRLTSVQEFHRWRAMSFETLAFALALRICLMNVRQRRTCVLARCRNVRAQPVTWIRGLDIPGMMFWHDSRS
eukprot:6571317-Pyramimonas_sp.AAC.1